MEQSFGRSASRRRRITRASLVPLVLAVVGTVIVAAPQSAGAWVRYTATSDGLALRSGPGTQYSVVQRVNAGTPLDIACQVQGGTNVGGNATWDRLTGGMWVADFYTTTPSFNSFIPGIGDCNAPATPAPAQTREIRAVAWARAEIASPNPRWSDFYQSQWSGMCERFVEQAYGTTGRYMTALANLQAQRAAGRLQGGTPPAGALVFYVTGDPSGHVALSAGGGLVLSTNGGTGANLPVAQFALNAFSGYQGWSWAPTSWTGR